MALPLSHLTLPLLAAAVCLSSCATVKRLTPDLPKIPMPSLPKFSTLKKVTRILPGMPDHDKVNDEDPQMPFNARGTLGYGHSLRVHVYEGTRSTKRVYNGVVMVDAKGVVDFGDKIGRTQIGGAQLPKAVEAIAATFRVGLRLNRPLTVHILSVEDVPVVSITGDVIKDEFIPAWDGMTIQQAVTVAGGRKLGSTNRGVYVIREGNRRFYSSLEAATEKTEPEPGDIIHLSPDF
ncbi:hypothetical protein SAMN02745166_04765 [Prosthecobacter debontii]|uniref:Polysaccharide export outer membrane protein n=1 Tax=Prosthecobacter debontii TaxID=48467 RepID=A0A1T4Z1L0_9BACT|nr:hypothetical protein [Prosthecobacter debontii]SKB07708.1 hypothetical protein SAMN02745166_04765 [Prosthecobacter debontii]